MSGILGIYRLDDKSLDPSLLEHMTDSLARRGPDAAGTWQESSVGLGHRMLWTTPESLYERLPFTLAPLTVTSDARIDNRDELISVFGLTASPDEIADSELIVRAYDRWGRHCPEHLLGDFAFAIWDGSQQQLFCARDHMGVKPFYYYHAQNHLFAFASEIKALFTVPDVPRKVNEVQIMHYLKSNFEDREITFYADIVRLPAAHTLLISDRRVELRRYWFLDPTREIHLASDEEYARAYRDLFTQAVRCRLRSAYPVGSLLSGGLDSSSVVCVARELLRKQDLNGRLPSQRLQTFSAFYDNVPESDERYFINAIVAQGDLESHLVPADERDPFDDVQEIVRQLDQLYHSAGDQIGLALLAAARNARIRVILDGEDGDSVVSHGDGRFFELARNLKLRTLLREINALSKRTHRSRRDILLPMLVASAPNIVRRTLRRAVPQVVQPAAPELLIKRDFAERIKLEPQVDIVDRARSTTRTARERHYKDLTAPKVQFDLEVMDQIFADFSMEGRHPFYDRRLVEFCLALPAEQKLSAGFNRVVARRALVNCLPRAIRCRVDKSSNAAVFYRGLRTFDKALVQEVLSKEHRLVDNYVEISQARKAFDLVTKGDTRGGYAVWQVVVLELWLQKEKERNASFVE